MPLRQQVNCPGHANHSEREKKYEMETHEIST
jgi:hypothetical protein